MDVMKLHRLGMVETSSFSLQENKLAIKQQPS